MSQAQVFAGIDSSSLSESVADYASWIATTVDAPLTLLHNIEHSEIPATSDLSGSIGLGSREHLLDELIELESRRNKLLIEQGHSLLGSAHDKVVKNGVLKCNKLQRHGAFGETLVELEDQIRVLVLGARGEDHNTDSKGLGRQIESIIRALHKPVLVVNRPFTQPQQLVLAYDGSEAAEKALDWLVTSPLYKEMTCHLVHVCSDENKGRQILERAESKLSAAHINAQSKVLNGDILSELLHYQKEHQIDLFVMGSFGHSRIREMVLGSLTLKMLTHASIPLLLLR